MRKVGVTGCTGFIGSHLVEALKRREAHVKCLVRKTSKVDWLKRQGVDMVVGDYNNVDSLIPFVQGTDIIIHVAGQIRGNKRDDFINGNYLITKNLVESILKSDTPVQKFLYISSQAAAGPSMDGTPVKPSDEPHPVSFYGESKMLAERYIRASGLPFTIIRPSVVYGPRDLGMYYVFKGAHKGLLFTLSTPEKFDLIYVEDLINIIIRAIESEVALNKVYFATDGLHYTIEDVKEILEAVVKKKIKLVKIPTSIVEVLRPLIKMRITPITDDKLRELKQRYWICSAEETFKDLKINLSPDTLSYFKQTYEFYLKAGYLK